MQANNGNNVPHRSLVNLFKKVHPGDKTTFVKNVYNKIRRSVRDNENQLATLTTEITIQRRVYYRKDPYSPRELLGERTSYKTRVHRFVDPEPPVPVRYSDPVPDYSPPPTPEPVDREASPPVEIIEID